MIGLAVYLNGKRMTVAGADDLCVLNAIVNAVGELGASTVRVGKRLCKSCKPTNQTRLQRPMSPLRKPHCKREGVCRG
jgi:hypothetical protein